MQSSVLCGVRVNMIERRPLVAIGRKATDRIRDTYNGTLLERVVDFHLNWVQIKQKLGFNFILFYCSIY